jgi:hypothetical protein
MPTGGPYNVGHLFVLKSLTFQNFQVSKFGIAAYCDTIRVELAQFGVHGKFAIFAKNLFLFSFHFGARLLQNSTGKSSSC